jgi:predicted Rossmann-fold nucleotide-binding protein
MVVPMLTNGAVADGALKHGGKVIGVLPVFFSKELAHNNLTELILVDTMHERKTK